MNDAKVVARGIIIDCIIGTIEDDILPLIGCFDDIDEAVLEFETKIKEMSDNLRPIQKDEIFERDGVKFKRLTPFDTFVRIDNE